MVDNLYSEEVRLVAGEGIATADLDGEAVLLDVNSGKYFGLNEVGARIMELLQEPTSVGDVMNVLLEEFNTDKDSMSEDLQAFLGKMVEHQLIQVVE